MSQSDIILELRNISKSFPNIKALEDVSVNVREGEILAILGENGAGKSTLMKILSGLYHPDEGEILINEEWFRKDNHLFPALDETAQLESSSGLLKLNLNNPRFAMQIGIGQVYQHFQLVEPFTVTENIILGKEETIDLGKEVNQRASKLFRNSMFGWASLALFIYFWLSFYDPTILGRTINFFYPIQFLFEDILLFRIGMILAFGGITYFKIREKFDFQSLLTPRRGLDGLALLLWIAFFLPDVVTSIIDAVNVVRFAAAAITVGLVVYARTQGLGFRSLIKWRNLIEVLVLYLWLAFVFEDLFNPISDIVMDKTYIRLVLLSLSLYCLSIELRNRWELGLVNQDFAESEVKRISKEFGLPIDPTERVENLPVGLKQRVEILKQLYRDARLLILDEPTAVLTPSEVKDLFATMRELKKSGRSLIFISHKLNEPLEIADRIVTIRKGQIVGETTPKETDREQLAEMIVGRKIVKQLKKSSFDPDQVILEVKDITVRDHNQTAVVKNVSFPVYKQRILGIAGVQGNGQSELLDGIMGLRRIEDGGEVIFKGTKHFENKTTLEILKSGIAYIPEDRSSQGLVLDFKITDNIWLGFFDNSSVGVHYIKDNVDDEVAEIEPDLLKSEEELQFWEKFRKTLFVPIRMIRSLSRIIITKLDVRGGGIDSHASDLSGGNQQKVLLGRELAKKPELIIASQPTRGVDVGVMENVHRELLDQRDAGAGILLISSDLEEVLALSDDILVMYEGMVAGYGKIEDFTVSQISQMMTSGKLKMAEVPAK